MLLVLRASYALGSSICHHVCEFQALLQHTVALHGILTIAKS